jgi:hypothetical protein
MPCKTKIREPQQIELEIATSIAVGTLMKSEQRSSANAQRCKNEASKGKYFHLLPQELLAAGAWPATDPYFLYYDHAGN